MEKGKRDVPTVGIFLLFVYLFLVGGIHTHVSGNHRPAFVFLFCFS